MSKELRRATEGGIKTPKKAEKSKATTKAKKVVPGDNTYSYTKTEVTLKAQVDDVRGRIEFLRKEADRILEEATARAESILEEANKAFEEANNEANEAIEGAHTEAEEMLEEARGLEVELLEKERVETMQRSFLERKKKDKPSPPPAQENKPTVEYKRLFFTHDEKGEVDLTRPFKHPLDAKYFDEDYVVIPCLIENGKFVRPLTKDELFEE